MPDFIFSRWGGVSRILLVAPAAYVALVFILRLSHQGTQSKLNAFDFIVTVAIGSTLASVVTTQSLSLVEGIAALGLLLGLQFLATAIPGDSLAGILGSI